MPEADVTLVATHDYVNLPLVSNFIDYHIVHDIFSNHSSRTFAGLPVLVDLEKIKHAMAINNYSCLLNTRINIGSNTISAHVYGERKLSPQRRPSFQSFFPVLRWLDCLQSPFLDRSYHACSLTLCFS